MMDKLNNVFFKLAFSQVKPQNGFVLVTFDNSVAEIYVHNSDAEHFSITVTNHTVSAVRRFHRETFLEQEVFHFIQNARVFINEQL